MSTSEGPSRPVTEPGIPDHMATTTPAEEAEERAPAAPPEPAAAPEEESAPQAEPTATPKSELEETLDDVPLPKEGAATTDADRDPEEASSDDSFSRMDGRRSAPAEAPEAFAVAAPASAARDSSAPSESDPSLDDIPAANLDGSAEPAGADEPKEDIKARSGRMSVERLATIVESLLFVSDQPLTLEAIQSCAGLTPVKAQAALEHLRGVYCVGQRGIVLTEVAGGWQFRTSPDSADYVRRMLQIKPQRLTRAALETLALFAYRQPITRPEVEQVRGVDSGAVIKALLERKLIKILGKKEEVGRPILYGTTREFLEFFNLKDLASLPTLREFQELSEEHREIVDEQTQPPPEPIQGLVAQHKDEAFVARQRESAQASEDALSELEEAMGNADRKSKATDEMLRPPAPTPESAEEA